MIAERLAESSKATLGPLADLISPRTGIIRSLSRVSRGTEEPSPPVVCQCLVSQFDYRAANTTDRMTYEMPRGWSVRNSSIPRGTQPVNGPSRAWQHEEVLPRMTR